MKKYQFIKKQIAIRVKEHIEKGAYKNKEFVCDALDQFKQSKKKNFNSVYALETIMSNIKPDNELSYLYGVFVFKL